MHVEWVDGVDGPIRPPREQAPRDDTVVRNAPIPMVAPPISDETASALWRTLFAEPTPERPKHKTAKGRPILTGIPAPCPFCGRVLVMMQYHVSLHHPEEVEAFYADRPKPTKWLKLMLDTLGVDERSGRVRGDPPKTKEAEVPEPVIQPDDAVAGVDDETLADVGLVPFSYRPPVERAAPMNANDIAGLVMTSYFGTAVVPLEHIAAFLKWQQATIEFLAAIS